MCILCGAQGVRRNFFCTYCLVQGKKHLSVGYRVFFKYFVGFRVLG